MSTEVVTLFFAMLAVVAEVLVAVVLVTWLGAGVSQVPAGVRRWAIEVVGPEGVGLAAAVAGVAAAGSLYLSEVANFTPCRLCWYQRGAMYPLAVILALAAWRRWFWVRPWAIALAGAGAGVSTYHVALQRFPSLGSTTCDPTNPCTLLWVEHFGYLTTPAMALSGFALIITLLALSRSFDRVGSTIPSTGQDRIPTRTSTTLR